MRDRRVDSRAEKFDVIGTTETKEVSPGEMALAERS